MITIEEVEGRSEQGVLKPFLCRGDNGRRYFVKGRGAGRSSLIAEYLAGSLGQSWGLPIPPFEIVEVPPDLIQFSAVPGILELGAGLAFGSERLPFVQEFGAGALRRVPVALRRDVMLFDWWIQNQDRSFRGTDGNPNLLWNTEQDSLVVIDHNLAFDGTLDPHVFWQLHAFADEKEIFLDPAFRREQSVRLEATLPLLDTTIESLPEEWHYEDAFQSVKSDFDFERAKAMLCRFHTEDFWNIFNL